MQSKKSRKNELKGNYQKADDKIWSVSEETKCTREGTKTEDSFEPIRNWRANNSTSVTSREFTVVQHFPPLYNTGNQACTWFRIVHHTLTSLKHCVKEKTRTLQSFHVCEEGISFLPVQTTILYGEPRKRKRMGKTIVHIILS